ncbi:polysaccharide deacetylase family protein [Gemelliphila palaticanis]|uniref:Polysaccharide deacetylase family protein n=1 Tax=Gemelliphila palaticanis TaxID=81950 RepID=A0ABX2SZH2_9BACL|nr:polysaccharide deacetylase family protein [Gemella palaticanis]MBF0715847.1 polysaccharide deacetylase family protein [Gemella palaticanis]NYS47777.1 polysaccharide deacetylase family protein [Gemella palaticanis]
MKKLYAITIVILLVLSSFFIYYKFFYNNELNLIDNSNKNLGSYNIVKKENYILADLNTEDSDINKIIDEYKNKLIVEAEKNKDKKYVIDFDSNLYFDTIIQIRYKLISQNNDVQDIKNIIINKTSKKELLFEDIFRNNPFLLKDYFPNVNIEDVDKNIIQFEDNNILVGNKENQLVIDTKSMTNLFKNGNGIPNLYNGEVLKPKKFNYDLNKKLIAFTFDDGPLNENHIKIRNLFNEYNIPATFYVIGNLVDSRPDVVKQTYLDGHTIANHTYTHPGLPNYNLTTLSPENIRSEIEKTDDAIFKTIGVDATTSRPPGGFTNKYVEDNTVLPMIKWDVDSQDWRFKNNPSVVYKNVRPNIKPNSIVLFHDLYPSTYEAVKKLIPELIAEGYQFVDIDTLLEVKESNKKSS